MACPICDQKPMNCDCTAEERRQYGEIEDLEDEIARLRLTDEERSAVEAAIAYMAPVGNYDSRVQATLRGLLERIG